MAEIFGTEMAKSMRYTISNQLKIAIFTYNSCTIRVSLIGGGVTIGIKNEVIPNSRLALIP